MYHHSSRLQTACIVILHARADAAARMQIRDQFYYVVALNQQRSHIVQLLQRVNHTCHSIVKAGQPGKAPPLH